METLPSTYNKHHNSKINTIGYPNEYTLYEVGIS